MKAKRRKTGKTARPCSAKNQQAIRAVIEQRVADILRVILDGAQSWDVWQYVSDQNKAQEAPWDTPKPISRRQIQRYMAMATKLIASDCRISRTRLLQRHLARRGMLYARTVASGDYRVALSVLQDLAKLEDLYPDQRIALLGQRVEELEKSNAGFSAAISQSGRKAPGSP
jgi:hypothetical protein